eukprot:Hpha_TRINITY_DN11067_c0_g1::TRINITY_DN11067_c0_g1_i1::g.93076::m.93076
MAVRRHPGAVSALRTQTTTEDAPSGFLPPLPGALPSVPAPPQMPPSDRAPRRPPAPPPYTTRRRLGAVQRPSLDIGPAPPPPPPRGPAPRRSRGLKQCVAALTSISEVVEAESGLRELVRTNERTRRRRLVLDSLREEAGALHRGRMVAEEKYARREVFAEEHRELARIGRSFESSAPGIVAQVAKRLATSLASAEATEREQVKSEALAPYASALKREAARVHLRALPRREYASRVAIVGQEWCGAVGLVGALSVFVTEAGERDDIRELLMQDREAERLRARERLFAERLELDARDRLEGLGWRQLLKLGDSERRARADAIERDIPTHEEKRRRTEEGREADARLLLEGMVGGSAREAVILELMRHDRTHETAQRAAAVCEEEAVRKDFRLAFARGFITVSAVLEAWQPERTALERDALAARQRCEEEEAQRAASLEHSAEALLLMHQGIIDEQDSLSYSERMRRADVSIDEGSSYDMLDRARRTDATVSRLWVDMRRTGVRETRQRIAVLHEESAAFTAILDTHLSGPLILDEESAARAALGHQAEGGWESLAARISRSMVFLSRVLEAMQNLQLHEQNSRAQLEGWDATRQEQFHDRLASIQELGRARAEESRLRTRHAVCEVESGARRLTASYERSERAEVLGQAVWRGEWLGRRLVMQDEFDERMEGYMWALECAEAWSRWVYEVHEVMHRWWYVIKAYDSAALATHSAIERMERGERRTLERHFQRRITLSEARAELLAETLADEVSEALDRQEPEARSAVDAAEKAARWGIDRSFAARAEAMVAEATAAAASVLRAPVSTLLQHEEEFGRVRVAGTEQAERTRLARGAPLPPRAPADPPRVQFDAELCLTLERAMQRGTEKALVWRGPAFLGTVGSATRHGWGLGFALLDVEGQEVRAPITEEAVLKRVKWMLERCGIELREADKGDSAVEVLVEAGRTGAAPCPHLEVLDYALRPPVPVPPSPQLPPPSPAAPEEARSVASSDVSWLPDPNSGAPLPWEELLLVEALQICFGKEEEVPSVSIDHARGMLRQEGAGREAVRSQQHRAHAGLRAAAWKDVRLIEARASAWQAAAQLSPKSRRVAFNIDPSA